MLPRDQGHLQAWACHGAASKGAAECRANLPLPAAPLLLTGTNYLERWFTPEGVGGLCQVSKCEGGPHKPPPLRSNKPSPAAPAPFCATTHMHAAVVPLALPASCNISSR